MAGTLRRNKMKRSIDGKIYNTETAKFIAEYGNRLGQSNFKNYEESLYKTSKGSYFLSGSGGALTKYSKQYGSMTGEGDGIIPLSDDEALAWLEQHEKTKAIEEHFFNSIEEA